MRVLALATAMGLTASATSVQAADLLPIPELDPPLIVNPFDGFYIGGNVGHGWGEFPNNLGPVAAGLGFGVTDDLSDADGFFGGFQGGFNYSFDNILLGVEGEINFSDISDNLSVAGVVPGSADLDYFGSISARIGFLPTESILLYAKGGYAFGGADASVDLAALGGGVVSDSNFHNGWTVGGGVEYAISDSYSVKLEYNYIDLEQKDFNLGLGTPVSAGFEGHLVKVGVNVLF